MNPAAVTKDGFTATPSIHRKLARAGIAECLPEPIAECPPEPIAECPPEPGEFYTVALEQPGKYPIGFSIMACGLYESLNPLKLADWQSAEGFRRFVNQRIRPASPAEIVILTVKDGQVIQDAEDKP